MQKDFITVTPDSGGSGSTTVTVAASANQTESTRSTSLSVAGGGMTRTVGASQAAGVVTWNYYFSVTPTSLSFVAGGETKSVTVTSYRKKVINGVETSTQENVPWTVTGSSGFNVADTRVVSEPNPNNNSRTGTATYKQDGTNKTVTVDLAQAAPKINPLRIEITTPGSTESQVYMFNKGGEPTYPPSAYQPVSSGTKNYVEIKWNNIRGLEVFDPNTKSKVFIHAGDVPLIIMKRERGDLWAFNQTNFRLEDTNQTKFCSN